MASVSAAGTSVICYCLASILMTLVNKFVVSGPHFSMTFLLLAIQSSVCIACVLFVKRLGIISFRQFDLQDAKMWFPISFMLTWVIYTGSKSLQYLSIPVYTIFKNLTIILIAYGEVLWFGGRVTTLTLISFVFMVLSSVIAAWSDVSSVLPVYSDPLGFQSVTDVVYKLNIGYFWMFVNCLVSAAYVLTMRKPAVGISYTTAWCIRVTSSTTYSMVGALNKLPVAASGMIFFGDVVTVGSVSAIAVGFFAGIMYAVAKNNQKKTESTETVIPLANRKP
ncbi:hypothetical protein D9758_011093 [Tetrapyrgos nigripes]|uniref:GDP-mannose transporter n=1 Tax=Tetrapyrgos nigripes TaxID=182062 RepID=A0A8H5CSI8_9AGAR|nr:hypothetical protein D9758_011093 [Tetrapyrgos nigripes]